MDFILRPARWRDIPGSRFTPNASIDIDSINDDSRARPAPAAIDSLHIPGMVHDISPKSNSWHPRTDVDIKHAAEHYLFSTAGSCRPLKRLSRGEVRHGPDSSIKVRI
jgi:hypothetical protein